MSEPVPRAQNMHCITELCKWTGRYSNVRHNGDNLEGFEEVGGMSR